MTKRASDIDYLAFAHRLRVTRMTLGISEQEAAKAADCTLRSWRKYEATGEGRLTSPICCFADYYDVSLDWLLCGDGSRVRKHLSRSATKVAILPVMA